MSLVTKDQAQMLTALAIEEAQTALRDALDPQ